MSIEINVIVDLLEDLGNDLLRWRSEGYTDGTWHDSQFKAEADYRAHTRIVSALESYDSSTPVWSEEDMCAHTIQRPSRYWLIDPIDGTASWVGGFSGFVTQVALVVDAEPELAVIRAPARDETYVAVRGQGACMNGLKLRATPRSRCLLIDNYPKPRGVAAALYESLPCSGYVESGSIALKMCLVAGAQAEVFVKDVIVRDWDIAAPALIVAEAGASLQDLHGQPYRFEGSLAKEAGIVTAADYALAKRVVAWYANWEGCSA